MICCVSSTSGEMPKCASSHGAARVWNQSIHIGSCARKSPIWRSTNGTSTSTMRDHDDDHDEKHEADRDRARHALFEPVDERIGEIGEQRRDHERRQHRREQVQITQPTMPTGSAIASAGRVRVRLRSCVGLPRACSARDARAPQTTT